MDTIKLGLKYKRRDAESFYIQNMNILRNFKVLQKISSLYDVEIRTDRRFIKSSFVKYIHKVSINIKNTKKEIVIFFWRKNGFLSNYDMIIQSHLSHFINIQEFYSMLLEVFVLYPKMFIECLFSRILELHLKIDTNININKVISSLDYPNGKNPFVLLNEENQRKTFYISRNFYVYEKYEHVRFERRYKGQQVRSSLKLDHLFQLSEEYNSAIPFGKVRFLDINSINSQLTREENTAYLELISLVNSIESESYKANVSISFNSFLNAKKQINSIRNKVVTNRLIPKMKIIEFDLQKQFEENAKFFLEGGKAMTDKYLEILECELSDSFVRVDDELLTEILSDGDFDKNEYLHFDRALKSYDLEDDESLGLIDDETDSWNDLWNGFEDFKRNHQENRTEVEQQVIYLRNVKKLKWNEISNCLQLSQFLIKKIRMSASNCFNQEADLSVPN